jgi:pimeloyl-ACP methyl ester carboxylesterase
MPSNSPWSFRKDQAAARRHLASIPSAICESSFGDIEYLLQGTGPTVLVSHGVTGGIDQGLRFVRDFQILPPTCRFLYVSRFGYLRSSLPKVASARGQAAAYRELLDHLGIQRVFVFGNSAGGPSAMWFAIDSPDRTLGLILVSSAVPGATIATAPRSVFRYDFVYWLAVRFAPNTLMKLFVPASLLPRLTAAERTFVIENAFKAALPISQRSDGIFFDNEVSTPSVEGVPFEQIAAPTLIVHAVDDPAPPVEGARAMAARIPHSELVTLDGGHLLLRRERDVGRAIEGFIAGHG